MSDTLWSKYDIVPFFHAYPQKRRESLILSCLCFKTPPSRFQCESFVETRHTLTFAPFMCIYHYKDNLLSAKTYCKMQQSEKMSK